MARQLALLLAVFGASVSPASGLTLTLDPGVGVSSVGNRVCTSGTFCLPGSQPTGPAPATGTLIPFLPLPPFEAQIDYALNDSSLAFDFFTARTDVIDQEASVKAEIFFSVDEAAGYDLSAQWTLDDPSQDFAAFLISLVDLTDATVLYYHGFMIGGDFVFDTAAPDPFANVMGSTTGLLVAGHEYRLSLDALSVTSPDFGPEVGLVTGTGSATLLFLPEPGVPAFWLGTLAAWVVRRSVTTAAPA